MWAAEFFLCEVGPVPVHGTPILTNDGSIPSAISLDLWRQSSHILLCAPTLWNELPQHMQGLMQPLGAGLGLFLFSYVYCLPRFRKLHRVCVAAIVLFRIGAACSAVICPVRTCSLSSIASCAVQLRAHFLPFGLIDHLLVLVSSPVGQAVGSSSGVQSVDTIRQPLDVAQLVHGKDQ